MAPTHGTADRDDKMGALGDYARAVNVGTGERIGSVAVGVALAALGFSRRSLGGLALAVAGGFVAYRGLSGHCQLYSALGVDTLGVERLRRGNLGLKIDRSILVNAAPARVYAFWRRFENLPQIMSNVESVQPISDTRSHWRVRAPGGATVEWDAEIINDRPEELIAWKSLPGSPVEHAGSVHFDSRVRGRATRVRVSLQYDPPGGELGHAVASLFSANAGQQIDQDLRNFKEALEAGYAA